MAVKKKKVSRRGVSVSGEMAAKARKSGAQRAGVIPSLEPQPEPPASREERTTAARIKRDKLPTSEQWSAMAGAMHNALERLRVFYLTMANLQPPQGSIQADKNFHSIIIHPSEREVLLREVAAAADILRVGLKARYAK